MILWLLIAILLTVSLTEMHWAYTQPLYIYVYIITC